MQRTPATAQAGLTLIDLAIVLAVCAIVLGQALPSLVETVRLHTLRGVAHELESDLQLARSQAVMQNRPLRLSFGAVGGTSCYMLHTGSADSCRCGDGGPARCDNPADLLRAVVLESAHAPRLHSRVRSVLADPTQGTLTPTLTVRVVPAAGPALHLVGNIVGRVRTCADGGPVAGLPACE